MKVISLSHPTSSLHASILLPASKSISNRALILQAVTGHSSVLQNLSTADDTQLMQSVLSSNQSSYHLKNAGTCMRFLTAYFAATPGNEITLLCDERMEQRPIHTLVNALRILGADIQFLHQDGFPPLRIKGKQLNGGQIQIAASASSQFVSALMMIAPLCKTDLSIELTGDITSLPYIEMTVKMMEQLGINIVKENSKNSNKLVRLSLSKPLPEDTVARDASINSAGQYTIESDWSSASYWYETVALSKDAQILLPGLSLNSLQGDVAIAQHMELFGVHTTETDSGITLTKTPHYERPQHPILDLTHCPDLAPALAVTAAACNQNTTLTGLQNLAIKESNRLLALHTELHKLGYHTSITTDSITIHAQTSQLTTRNSQLATYGDHRMAMAFAPLALVFPTVSIEQPEVVEKSYPHFWTDLLSAGFSIQSFDY